MKVVTNKVRASYLAWHTPREGLDGKMSYSVELLIPKSDVDGITKIKAAMKSALEKKFGDLSKVKGLKNPLKDGDGMKQDGTPHGPEYHGHFYLRCKSTKKPSVIDIKGKEIINSLDFISGDYCRASIMASAYDSNMAKGVTFYLNNLQKVADGESLGGTKTSAAEDFGVQGSANADFAETANESSDIPF
jgi:hypothetical protein